MIRAVIDTNVLVSGLLSAAGNEALILLAVRQGRVRPCLSEAIAEEYAGVLARPKFSFELEQVEGLLATFREHGEMFRPEGFQAVSPDPTDTKFLHCALAARADFIVTGNKRDFPDAPYGPTHVVSAGELLGRITLEM